MRPTNRLAELWFFRTLLPLATFVLLATTVTAGEPKELCDARRAYDSLKHPSEAQRVDYITRLIRLRESFTRADEKALDAIDTEVIKHPMPAVSDSQKLSKRLIGRWQSPRRPYFYHAGGSWASDEDTPEYIRGTWRIEGNTFFQNYGHDKPDVGETIILLTSTDFVFGTHISPYYLRRGDEFPWH